ncbi:hypothetical protein P9112_004666 [Eukaryota sp. TZLM1-RC]
MGLISKLLDWLKSLFWKQEMELSLLGLGNSGKTTFVGVVSTGEFTMNTIPTVGFQVSRVQRGNVSIKLWDIGGQSRFRSQWERYCRGCNSIVFMVDAADTNTHEEAKEALHELLSRPSLAGIPVLVLGNKNDLKDSLTAPQLVEVLDLKSIQDRQVDCYDISCKNMVRIDLVLQWLVRNSVRRT